MRVSLTCKRCQHAWTVTDEPQGLAPLACPQCDNAAEQRAAEDLASSVEDALCQLGLLGKSLQVDITLSSEALPEPFRLRGQVGG